MPRAPTSSRPATSSPRATTAPPSTTTSASIATAMPALPVPARPRDFRLSPEQAASIRPAGWRRLLAPLAGPRFAFAAPLGGSLAALGIAGILVAGAAGTPLAGVRRSGRSHAPPGARGRGDPDRGSRRVRERLGWPGRAAPGRPATGERRRDRAHERRGPNGDGHVRLGCRLTGVREPGRSARRAADDRGRP